MISSSPLTYASELKELKQLRKRNDNSVLSFLSNNQQEIIFEESNNNEGDSDMNTLGKLSMINASARFQLLSAN